jgi:hypothetical protein
MVATAAALAFAMSSPPSTQASRTRCRLASSNVIIASKKSAIPSATN